MCIDVQAPNVSQLVWRVKSSSGTCVISDGVTTGYLEYTTLEQYNALTGTLTGVDKPNTAGQPDYVFPIYSPSTCIAAKWIIDEDYSYCEQGSEAVFYLWAKLTSYPSSVDPQPNTPDRGHDGETCTTTTVEGNFVVRLYRSSSQTELVDEVLQASTVDGVSVEYFISDFYEGISTQNIADFSFDNSDLDTQYSSTNPYSCSSSDPPVTRLTVLQLSYDGRVSDVGTGFEIYIKPITDTGDNTGFLIQPKEKKVTNDVNEFPVDINNQLCSVSGLPQAIRDNPTDSPTYRVLNTTACPVDSSDEVTLTVNGSYNELDSRFEFTATISEILENDLVVNFDYSFKDGEMDSIGFPQEATITAGSTIGTVNQSYTPSAGAITDIVITIGTVSPNPNGTKTIIY